MDMVLNGETAARDGAGQRSRNRDKPTMQAVVFDFDGTLAELNIDFNMMADKVRELARNMGFAGAWPLGGYLLEQVEVVAGAMGNGFSQKAHELIKKVEMEAADEGRLFDFTPGLLARARQRKLGLAVISRNCGPAIRRVFPGVDQEVDVFLPREAVINAKPHPDHVLDALKVLGAGPGGAVMVGDHPTDIQAGKSAGCLTVGVATGRMNLEELASAGADLVLADASGLLDALDRR